LLIENAITFISQTDATEKIGTIVAIVRIKNIVRLENKSGEKNFITGINGRSLITIL
jgi:hypothetical protein